MKKRFFALLGCVVLLCTLLLFTAGAEGNLLVDDAELLNVDERTEILTQLNEASNSLDCDLVIVTTEGLRDNDPYSYSRDIYAESGYGRGEEKSGVMMLIAMEEGEGNNYYHITPFGKCVDYFSESSLNTLCDKVESDLVDKDFDAACNTFIKETKKIIHKRTRVFSFPRLGAALGIGLLIALIVVGSMKAKLKSVRFQPEANNYLKPGSLNVTLAQEHFLYHTVSRTARPKNNSSGGSHVGSGGVSHGGGGRF